MPTKDFSISGGGVLAVMHDLNLTGLFADRVVVMSGGQILAHGPPREVMSNAVLSTAYGCTLEVSQPPTVDTPLFLPHTASLLQGNAR